MECLDELPDTGKLNLDEKTVASSANRYLRVTLINNHDLYSLAGLQGK